MNNFLKKILFCLCIGTATVAIAATEVVGGVEWTYVAMDGCSCKLYKGTKSSVIASDLKGKLRVPDQLGGLIVTEIGDWALYNCANITEVSMPDTVQNIGDNAFAYCSSLEVVTLSTQLQTIAQNAFSNCANLKSIDIPESLTKMGDFAFSFCSSLESIKFPSGLSYIPAYVLYQCTALKNFEAAKGTLKIGNYACWNCGNLTTVLLYDGLEEIGVDAFSRCSSLKTISIPSTVKSLGNFAFSFCSSLQSVYIPSLIKVVPKEAFAQCGKLKTVDLAEGVESIEDGAFANCDSLNYMELPSTCTNTVDFARFPLNVKIAVSPANAKLSSDDGAVFSRDLTALLFVPRCIVTNEYVVKSSVRIIGDSAFRDCSQITGVKFPDDLEKIGTESFACCYALTTVALGENVSEIGNKAFQDCTALKSVKLPSALNSIGDYAFGQCIELASIDMPKSISAIGEGAFMSCSSLTNAVIPSSVTKIASRLFDSCTSLKSVTIGNSVDTIDYWAFMNCTKIEYLELPDSVANIGSRVFYGCDSLKTLKFKGNAPSVVKKTFDGIPSGCKGVVTHKSTGWNVAIPGMWNGIFLQYEDSIHITYDMNFTGGNVTNVWMAIGDTLDCSPNRSDYVFLGWYTNPTNGTRVLTAESEGSVYAHWANAACRVSVETTYGTATGAGDYDYGTVVVLEAPEEPFPWQIDDNFSGHHLCLGTSSSSVLTNRLEFSILSDTNIFWDVWQTNLYLSCGDRESWESYADSTIKITPPQDSVYFDGQWESCGLAPAGSIVQIDLVMKPGWIVTSWNGLPDVDQNATNVTFAITTNLSFGITFASGACVPSEKTGGKTVVIEQSWVLNELVERYGNQVVEEFSRKYGSDFDKAIMMQNGKARANGEPMQVWEDFIAGTDPTNPDSMFTSTIEILNGEPVVKWVPDLNEDGQKSLRSYTTFGCKNIGGDWKDMSLVPAAEKSDYHFFKVAVGMP